MKIDHKQDRLIKGWIDQAQRANDPYFRFMSLWVAFNALCYALFHEEANKQRADLKTFRQSVDGFLDARVFVQTGKIEIEEPKLQLKLKIDEKYTENYIFSKYASKMQDPYLAQLHGDATFRSEIDSFREAIKKVNGYYVLNLSRKSHDEVTSWTEEQVKKGSNRLKSFHNERKLSLLVDVLYQVRCNVFHGEKIPGDLNDDRIVEAASPILRRLLEFYLSCAAE
jgi:hypothetical protein